MTNDNVDLFWLWNGIKYRYSKCCIFFFIYCTSIYNPSFYMPPVEKMMKVKHIARKLTEEEKKKKRKEWENMESSLCWVLVDDGPVLCPNCLANKLTRRKMTNSQAFVQEFQAWFLKEQK